jgi:hypothetical protein
MPFLLEENQIFFMGKIKIKTWVFKTFSRLSTSQVGKLAILFFRVEMSRYKNFTFFSCRCLVIFIIIRKKKSPERHLLEENRIEKRLC